MRNVMDFGATGDGIALDTEAIQKAIDAGGTVYFPAGTYRTGTLYLKSNGGLFLDGGAVIVGSHSREDYNADDYCPQNAVFSSEWVTGAHLISAVEQENITISGNGVIDGQGDFWVNDSRHYNGSADYFPDENRPAQMLFFCECKNVRVTGVNIKNGPYWHLFFHGCENVFADNLHITGDRPRWTNDGIDIDCCTNATVSNCIIDVGDDALTVRGNAKCLTDKNSFSQNITVMNCVLRAARDNGIRLGVGSALVTDCVFSNLIIEAPNAAGISIEGRWNENSPNGSKIDGILFSNIRVKANIPFYISVADGEKPLNEPAYIKNLSFSNITVCGNQTSVIKGYKEISLPNVSFTEVEAATGNAAHPLFTVSDAENIHFRSSALSEAECVKVTDSKAVTFNGKNI